MKVVHSWVKEYVGDTLPDAGKLEELLNFHAFEVDGVEEVNGEVVLDIDVLPNRASDCLSHRGIAREVAAILDISLHKDPLETTPTFEQTAPIEISIKDSKACPRFSASLVEGVTVGESPDWLKKRLEALGVRSVNNIVDATNYVMYALGEPLHAYDADLFPKVEGSWKFDVRFAEEGEKVSLLAEGGKDEDRVIECKGTELLIVDGSSNTPIGLAGVKGGRFAGVHPGTKNIIIEAAHFHPTVTRKTARRLGIVIDASKRFENEPSRELIPFAQRDAIALITDIAGGAFGGYVDEYLERKDNPTVNVSTSKTNQLLGLQLSETEIAALIKRTGSEVRMVDGGCEATGPFERTDLNIAEDFIEEVGRLYGLDKIASIPPETRQVSEYNARQYYSDKVRNILLELGFSEVVTSSFHKKGKIQLRNALASDKSYVRGNLRKNIETTLDKNFNHADLLGIPDIKVFEIGTVFTPKDGSIKEHLSLAVGVRSKGTGYSGVDDKKLQQALDTLSSELDISVDWMLEKGVAEINLSVAIDLLPEPTGYDGVEKSNDVIYQSPSSYPAVSRDIALWVDGDVESDSVANALSEAAGTLLVRQTLFDTFEKDGRTSYAFRLVFQSHERTLTDGEVNGVMDNVYKVAQINNWEVR